MTAPAPSSSLPEWVQNDRAKFLWDKPQLEYADKLAQALTIAIEALEQMNSGICVHHELSRDSLARITALGDGKGA